MALTYGFYNSIEGDRVYDAIQFGRIFDGIIKDGVYATYEKGMMVIASSSPAEVIIQPGRAWFNHTWSYNDANVIFEAPDPEVLLERIDALVLEVNEELSARENSYKWITGTPSSRPERPTLTNTSTIHQYPLCYVHRYPETTMIYTRDITNTIGTSECPFATGVLEGIDLDAWINQWDNEFHNWENTTKTGFEAWMLNQEQVYTTWFNSMHGQMDTDLAEFEAWFETIQGIIDEEAALHLQQEIDELRQEATSGSRIFVSTINQSLFGKNVTITEAGGTVFTSRFDNTGVAEFKSIPYVGSLTISSTDGIQTAISIVNTPYYARYNFAIAFWAATVNIVGDPEMSGSTVTVRDSNEIIVGTVTLDSEGTGVYSAIKPDTYKFTLTYGGETMEVTLSVTQETTYAVDLHAAGFDYKKWVQYGGLNPNDYASLSAVFADEAATRRLMLVHASADYLISAVTEDIDTIDDFTANDTAMKWIGLCDYVCDGLCAISGVWAKFMASSYWERILKDHVPTMTSNSAPYGEASASSVVTTGYEAYKAFDSNNSTLWAPGANVTNNYLQYTFTNPISIKKVHYLITRDAGAPNKTFTIQGSNDNWSTSANLGTFTVNADSKEEYIGINNSSYYLSYRIFCDETLHAGGQFRYNVNTLQFYGRSLNVSVPIMSGNTVPYGVVSSSTLFTSYQAYQVFDSNENAGVSFNSGATNNYLRYEFPHPVCCKQFRAKFYNDATSGNTFPSGITMKIQGSNDTTTWTEVGTATLSAGTNTLNITSNNTNSYKYYQFFCADVLHVYNNYCSYIFDLKFYGLDYSEKEFEAGTSRKWLYDHGVELEALEAFVNAYTSGSSVTKQADGIYCEASASGSYPSVGVCTTNAIDVSNYSILRAYNDEQYYPGGTSAMIGVNPTKSTPSTDGTAWLVKSIRFGGGSYGVNDIPFGWGVDISSVNQSVYINNAQGNVASNHFTLKEMWLE